MNTQLMKDNILSSTQRSVLSAETTTYHHQLITQTPSVIIPVNPDTPMLMPFNGYYTLSNAAGAFFAVDTNMVITPESAEPRFDLTLIVSLDGTSATRYAFTGTFDGITLNQVWEGAGFAINLTFSRTVDCYGPVASCMGNITLPGQPATPVSGSTYNNPISAPLFAGNYYVTTPNTKPIKVMSIGSENELSYDYGSESGQLSPVTAYAYNMNMYYFTFMQGSDTVSLIMGTAANKGFACNNMTTGTSLVARQLQTIPSAPTIPIELYDLSNSALADFSGYYAISDTDFPRGFVSIQAQYASLLANTQWDLTFVMISVSLDGVSSQGYYFNPFTMSFDGETLSMPQQKINLTLTRKYTPKNGSLVSMSGTINNQNISGYTPFNPVPLSVFGGQPMTNSNKDTLTVNNDNSVTYNGINMDSIIYVPLMYILAYPAEKPTVVMSFGTDGIHGNTCIVTVDANTLTPKTTTVRAIP